MDIIAGPWDHDGGHFLLRSAYVAEGLKPYLDFKSIYPPLMEVLMAPIVSLPLHRIGFAILIPLGWILANTLATGLLARNVTGDRAMATLAAALFPLFAIENGGNHLTLELGVSFFACLAFAALTGPTPLTPSRLAAAGACASAATLVKQTGILTFVVVAALLVTRRSEMSRRSLAWVAAAAAAPPLAVLVWLRGDVGAIYRNLFVRLSRYAQSYESPTHPLGLDWWRSPQTILFLALVIALAIQQIVRVPRTRLVTAAALACALAEYAPRFVRDYPHYNLNIWPFAVLILALATSEPRPIRASAARAAVAVFAVLAYGSLFIRPNPLYPLRWMYLSPLITGFYPAGKVIEAVTPPDAKVRQYGSEQIIEFLGYRHEELIDKPDVIFSNWDIRAFYDTLPEPSTTIVVVDSGEDWPARVAATIEQHGFVRLARVGPGPVISIYRHRDHLR